jgi:hypothetical protein
MIHSIAVDQSDNVWLALGEYVNSSYLLKISNDKWTVYTEEELGFMPYWWVGIQCDSKNRIWGTISYLFSSNSNLASSSPGLFIFDGKETTILCNGHDFRSGLMTIDHNDNAWSICNVWNGENLTKICGVWNGKNWIEIDIAAFGDSNVRTIKEAPDHKMWFGTDNGIYIQ